MDRAISLSGFTCPVARNDPAALSHSAGVAVGIDDNDAGRAYVLSLRHADGTVLTAWLSDGLLDRLALRLADLVDDDVPDAPFHALTAGTLQ